jgi:aldehyde:ferredoxin oxidoreductase
MDTMTNKILEIDVTAEKTATSEVPENQSRLGGRAMTSATVCAEVEPTCHPLSADNLLVFAPGLLAGTALSSANRLSAGAKSPLTGGIKETNSGGVIAHKLARLGIRALKIRGVRKEHGPLRGILVNSRGVSFFDLDDLGGKGTYQSAEALRERFGEKAGLMLIGPAGEMRLASACINITDPEGEPCRNLGRGGLGAVMGSKGIKAIVVDDSDAKITPTPEVRAIIKKFADALKENPVTGERFPKYGTNMTLDVVNKLGGLPTRNFSRGAFEGAEAIGGHALHDTLESRGGVVSHGCMPGCVIRCSNKYVDDQGAAVVGSVDYETVCLLGSNLGIDDLDAVAHLNRLCNDIGVDTIETGGALGVLAEGGLWEFGDAPRARELIEEIGAGTPLGRLIASGCVACGKAYGVERIPAVKGQGIAAYDPRAIKGQGLTYALSPMGADHTAGNAIVLQVDHLDPKPQLVLMRDLHLKTTVLDSLGLCLFTGRVSFDQPELVEQMCSALLDWNVSFSDLLKLAAQLLLQERDFNRRAGFTAAQDRLPPFMYTEKLSPHDSVFDVPESDVAAFYEF